MSNTVSRRSRHAVLLVALAAALAPARADAQNTSIPLNFQIGLPQGEFANNVKAAAGIGFGGLFGIGEYLGIRAGLDFQIYGAETRRVPLGGGALGLINVDVTTTNAIIGGHIGAQLGLPGPSLRPYVGGAIGFTNFTTTSSVRGSNSSDQEFASSTNSSDNAFAKIVFGGLYIPVGTSTTLDIGVRHTWNGESVRYLTPGDVSEDPVTGALVLSPNNTRADLLTIQIGVMLRPSSTRSPK